MCSPSVYEHDDTRSQHIKKRAICSTCFVRLWKSRDCVAFILCLKIAVES